MVVITYIMDFVSYGKKVKTKRNLTHLLLIYKRTLKYDLRNFFVPKPLGPFLLVFTGSQFIYLAFHANYSPAKKKLGN